MDDDEARADRIKSELDEAKHHGALLIAESAVEKALLMYQWREREEFHFGFDSRLYWWRLDISNSTAPCRPWTPARARKTSS